MHKNGIFLKLIALVLLLTLLPCPVPAAETGLLLDAQSLATTGYVHSAASWQGGLLLGAARGIFFYPGAGGQALKTTLPDDPASGLPIELTAILTQGVQAYALSLPTGLLYPLLLEKQGLQLGEPQSFDTREVSFVSADGSQKTWQPQQVLLEGNRLCLLSRFMQELGGCQLVVLDLNSGQTSSFPLKAGQIMSHLCAYQQGQLLALASVGSKVSIQVLNLDAGSQQAFADLGNSIRPGNAALLYHPAADALYLLDGARLLRRDKEGKLEEIALLNFEAGPFIRFGRLSWQEEGLLALAHPQGLALVSLTSPQETPLVIWGMDERDPAHVDARKQMGNQPLALPRMAEEDLAPRLSEALIAGLPEPDIFVLRSTQLDLPRLLAKGYAMDLQDQPALAGFAQAAYPQIQAQCVTEGRLGLLPIGLQIKGLQYDPVLMAQLGLALPADFEALMELVQGWPGLPGAQEEHGLHAWGGPRGLLTEALWQAWQADCQRQNITLTATELPLHQHLEAIQSAAVKAWPRNRLPAEAPVLFPQVLDPAFDLQRYTSFLNQQEAGHSLPGFISLPLPLALEQSSPPVLPAELVVMGINPHSQHKETALAYLNSYLLSMPAAQRILLCPGLNQAVSYSGLDVRISQARQELDSALQRQAQAAKDADHHALQQLVSQKQQVLDFWLSDPPETSSQAIQGYREWMKHLVVLGYQGTGGAAQAQLEALKTNFILGSLSVSQLLEQVQGILKLALMEEE